VSDDHSPKARHAEAHDARREELTNLVGPQREDPTFAVEPTPVETTPRGGHARESTPAAADKTLHDLLSSFSSDELARLPVLEPGTRLEQGGVYLDLNRLDDGPFQALGGHEATRANRLVAKRDTDYELWNRLAGQDAEPEIERPGDGVTE
jgi:hypothetical protein